MTTCKEIIRALKVDGNLVICVPGALGYTKDPDHKYPPCISRSESQKYFLDN